MKLSQYMISGVMLAVFCSVPAFAQGTSNVSLLLMPVQAAFVKGDVAKFKAINWIKDGSQSGVKELKADARIGKEVEVSFEGSGMPGDADYSGDMLITKTDVGYVKLTYDSFRRYYDPKGGYFPFATLKVVTLPQDLEMDIGRIAIEIGNKTPEESTFSLGYEHDSKDGSKDRLSWALVKDTATKGGVTTANTTRYTAPSWEDINESTDTLTARARTRFLGFNVKGEQKYEFFAGNTFRVEQWRDFDTTSVDTDSKKRTQSDDLQTKSLITKILADRWTLNDKTYLSMGYSYAHLRNSDIQELREYKSDGTLYLFSSGRYRDGHALNVEDKNTWTGHMMSEIAPALTFSTRLKAEAVTYKGSSEYGIEDTSSSVPTGIDYTYTTRTEKSELLTGESFSLKYNGIAKTSLFADLSLAQEATDLSRQRLRTGLTPGSGDFSRDVVNRAPEIEGTVGMRLTPFKTVSLTTDYKHSRKKDKVNEKDLSGSSADTLLNYFRTDKDQISSRLAWKPVKWLENSFRVKMADTVYHTSSAYEDMLKTQMNERNFIYDMIYMPTEQWMFDLSYSLQQFKASTRAVEVDVYPVYTANVYSWAFTSSYAPTEKLSFSNTLGYYRAKNPHGDVSTTNFTGGALSLSSQRLALGTDDEWYDAEFNVKWEPKKNLTIEPHYAYYGYRAYESIETGNYSAHVVWLDIGLKF